MGGIRSQSPKFASMFLLLVLASVALPTTFNFVGIYSIIVCLKLMYGLPFRERLSSWSILYVENVPTSNAWRNEYKKYLQTLHLKKDLLWSLSSLFILFLGMYPKYRLNHTKFGKYFNSY
jgi:NADH:ubiquinone oxidoreductase subunit 4 (subunit M)